MCVVFLTFNGRIPCRKEYLEYREYEIEKYY